MAGGIVGSLLFKASYKKKINENKIIEINQNTGIILGEKIFKTNTERVVDNLLEQNKEQIYADELIEICEKYNIRFYHRYLEFSFFSIVNITNNIKSLLFKYHF